MTSYQDLEPFSDFSADSADSDVVLHAVGWLGCGSNFPTGKVSLQFFDRLCKLLEDPFQPFISFGVHSCEICQFQAYEHTPIGSKNIFVPFDGALYVAPELIVHYINAHHYLPPSVFIEAVIQCPDMKSMDYKKLLLQNGGKGLIKPSRK
jgi:hypothetical protein